MADHIKIGDITPRTQYTITAGTVGGPWAYDFPIFEDENMAVYYNGVKKTLTSHYTVAGAGDSIGGTVSPVVGQEPAVDTVVTLVREIAIKRTSDFQESGEFRAKVINDQLDYLTAALQQVSNDQNRSVKLSVTDTFATLTLPTKSERANKYAAYDADGNLLAAVDPGSYPASTFGASLMDDADASVARVTLGLGAAAVEAVASGGSGDLLRADGDGSNLTGIAGGATDLQNRRIAWNAMQLMLTTSISSGAWLSGQLWELLTDEWGATSTGETYDATGDFYTNGSTSEDGNYGGTAGTTSGFGDSDVNRKNIGLQFTASATGTIASAKINVSGVISAFNCHAELWSDSAGSPGVQIGTDSATVALSSTGEKTFAFATPPSVTTSTVYWLILTDEDGGTGSVQIDGITGTASHGAGYHDTITSITDGGIPPSATDEWRIGISLVSASDMTLVSPAVAAAPSMQPVEQTTYFLWNDISTTAVLGTDLTVTNSNDGNTTKGAATLTDLGDFDGTYRLVEAKATSGMGTGTTPAVEIKTLNSKEQRIKPHLLGWTD